MSFDTSEEDFSKELQVMTVTNDELSIANNPYLENFPKLMSKVVVSSNF
jgi:hypothetical protein